MISLPSNGQSFIDAVMGAEREAHTERPKEGPKEAAQRADVAAFREKPEM